MARKRISIAKDLAKWTPRQQAAVDILKTGKVKYLLYGGALGGGKSYFLRWYAVDRLRMMAQRGFRNAAIMVACEDYPALKDRQLSKIAMEFPAWLGKAHSDHKDYGRSYILAPEFGSGVICFRNLDDPSKYQSAEFAAILVDELTKNPFEVFTFLRSRLRWRGLPDEDCIFVGATNPGGIGHSWCKQLWIDRDFPPEFVSPVDFRPQFAYVPSKADDNPHLDPAYWATLSTLPRALRKAFRDGDWNIFVGQAFPDFSRQKHVIPTIQPPAGAPLLMTYDWGWGKPFSIGWWFVDNDGRLIRFAEWYGWSGAPNEGLRLADSEVAAGIKEREARMGITGWGITRLAGHDCFQKRPNYDKGGQGPSTDEVFQDAGLTLSKVNPNREHKIRAFRERLRPGADGVPRLLVSEDCAQFIRTIPNIVMDARNVEDIDSDGEDHIYDEACLACLAREPEGQGLTAGADWSRR